MNRCASLPVSFGVCSISLQMYVKKLTPEASLAHYFQKKMASEGTKKDVPDYQAHPEFLIFEFCYFRNPSMVSGDAFNLVTAHKPAPISFTLAPNRYTSLSIIRKRSWFLWGS